MYLYKTAIIKNEEYYPNMTQQQIDDENANQSDFETNFKSQAVKVDDLIVAENTYLISLTYAAFKAKITGGVLWSDVKYFDNTKKYELNLLTNNPL